MEQSQPSDEVTRTVERRRLVYYKRAADASYWDEHWNTLLRPEFYIGAIKGDLGKWENLFTKYLPADEPILEAGCGLAQWVLALRKRGYDIEGVDWSEETIEKVHRIFPDLLIRSGDVCALDVEHGYYGAYISLGVIEHRAAGPEPFLTEAFRVLKPGGVAILSVPWFNPLRRLKAWLGCFDGTSVKASEFYQYAFTAREMEDKLVIAGFKVVEQSSGNLEMGFEDELPFLKSLYEKGVLGRILKRLVRKGNLVARLFGHSRVYVCRKPSSA